MIKKYFDTFIVGSFFMLTGCHKEEPVCHYSQPVVYPAEYVLFKGFSTEELDTLIMAAYVKGSNFSAVLETDTIITDSIAMNSDTAAVNGTSLSVDRWRDYKIYAGSDSFLLIPDTSGASVSEGVTSGDCSPGASSVITRTFAVLVNGEQTDPFDFYHNGIQRYLLLKKY